MKRHSFRAGVLCVILICLIAGAVCSWAAEAKPVPPAAPPGGAKAGTPAPAVAPPPAPQAPPYLYRPAGKPDPFQPFIDTELALQKKTEMEQRKKASMQGRPISPLQMAEIKQFRLVGIAGDDKGRMAIVEDTTVKKYYPLFVGTNIGPNEGRVASILSDRLIVEEPIPEAQPGKAQKKQNRTITIMLHEGR